MDRRNHWKHLPLPSAPDAPARPDDVIAVTPPPSRRPKKPQRRRREKYDDDTDTLRGYAALSRDEITGAEIDWQHLMQDDNKESEEETEDSGAETSYKKAKSTQSRYEETESRGKRMEDTYHGYSVSQKSQ